MPLSIAQMCNLMILTTVNVCVYMCGEKSKENGGRSGDHELVWNGWDVFQKLPLETDELLKSLDLTVLFFFLTLHYSKPSLILNNSHTVHVYT